MCHRHIPFVAPCTNFKPGTPNSQDYSFATPKDGYVELGDIAETEGIAITVECWIKGGEEQNAGFGFVAKAVDADQGVSWILSGRDKGASFMIADGTTIAIAGYSTVSVKDYSWHHIVGTWDKNGDGKPRLYIDGKLALTANRVLTKNIQDTTLPVQVGRWNSPGRFFTGAIDEVSIYNRALTAEEIEEHYNSAVSVKQVRKNSPAERLMNLSAPGGGELWSAGSLHYITWKREQIDGNGILMVEYSADDGKNWVVITDSIPNNGKLLWRVPNMISKKCRVRVFDNHSGTGFESKSNFSIVPSQEVFDYKWTRVTMKAPFAPRDGAGALVFKGKMWLLGGWNPKDKKNFPMICTNDVWSSTDGVRWILEKPNTFMDKSFNHELDWEGRHTAGYVVCKGKMWIVGGDPLQGHYQDDVWNSADGKTWVHVNKGKKVIWGPRVLHYTLVFKNKIWVMGGQTTPQYAPAEEIFYNDIWNTSDGVNWTQVKPNEPYWPQRGMIGGNVVFKDRIWILGGGTYNTPKVPKRKLYNDVWSSVDGVNWKQHIEHAPWKPRQYHDVAVFDNKMWVMEGCDKGNRKDVWYSSDGVNWYELQHTPWTSRHASSVFVYNNALWMVAGNNMKSDVWKLKRASLQGRNN